MHDNQLTFEQWIEYMAANMEQYRDVFYQTYGYDPSERELRNLLLESYYDYVEELEDEDNTESQT